MNKKRIAYDKENFPTEFQNRQFHIRKSGVHLPKHKTADIIKRKGPHVHTKNLRESIIETEYQKRAMQHEYYSLLQMTGANRYVTPKDQEMIISNLEDKNFNIKYCEQEVRYLKVEKEKLGKFWEKLDKIKSTFEKNFQHDEANKGLEFEPMKKRQIELFAENQWLQEELNKERLEIDNQKNHYSHKQGGTWVFKVDENTRQREDVEGRLKELSKYIQLKDEYFQFLQNQDSEILKLKNLNNELAMDLDSLNSQIAHSRIKQIPVEYWEDDEISEMMRANDNLLGETSRIEKANFLLEENINKIGLDQFFRKNAYVIPDGNGQNIDEEFEESLVRKVDGFRKIDRSYEEGYGDEMKHDKGIWYKENMDQRGNSFFKVKVEDDTNKSAVRLVEKDTDNQNFRCDSIVGEKGQMVLFKDLRDLPKKKKEGRQSLGVRRNQSLGGNRNQIIGGNRNQSMCVSGNRKVLAKEQTGIIDYMPAKHENVRMPEKKIDYMLVKHEDVQMPEKKIDYIPAKRENVRMPEKKIDKIEIIETLPDGTIQPTKVIDFDKSDNLNYKTPNITEIRKILPPKITPFKYNNTQNQSIITPITAPPIHLDNKLVERQNHNYQKDKESQPDTIQQPHTPSESQYQLNAPENFSKGYNESKIEKLQDRKPDKFIIERRQPRQEIIRLELGSLTPFSTNTQKLQIGKKGFIVQQKKDHSKKLDKDFQQFENLPNASSPKTYQEYTQLQTQPLSTNKLPDKIIIHTEQPRQEIITLDMIRKDVTVEEHDKDIIENTEKLDKDIQQSENVSDDLQPKTYDQNIQKLENLLSSIRPKTHQKLENVTDDSAPKTYQKDIQRLDKVLDNSPVKSIEQDLHQLEGLLNSIRPKTYQQDIQQLDNHSNDSPPKTYEPDIPKFKTLPNVSSPKRQGYYFQLQTLPSPKNKLPDKTIIERKKRRQEVLKVNQLRSHKSTPFLRSNSFTPKKFTPSKSSIKDQNSDAAFQRHLLSYYKTISPEIRAKLEEMGHLRPEPSQEPKPEPEPEKEDNQSESSHQTLSKICLSRKINEDGQFTLGSGSGIPQKTYSRVLQHGFFSPNNNISEICKDPIYKSFVLDDDNMTITLGGEKSLSQTSKNKSVDFGNLDNKNQLRLDTFESVNEKAIFENKRYSAQPLSNTKHNSGGQFNLTRSDGQSQMANNLQNDNKGNKDLVQDKGPHQPSPSKISTEKIQIPKLFDNTAKNQFGSQSGEKSLFDNMSSQRQIIKNSESAGDLSSQQKIASQQLEKLKEAQQDLDRIFKDDKNQKITLFGGNFGSSQVPIITSKTYAKSTLEQLQLDDSQYTETTPRFQETFNPGLKTSMFLSPRSKKLDTIRESEEETERVFYNKGQLEGDTKSLSSIAFGDMNSDKKILAISVGASNLETPIVQSRAQSEIEEEEIITDKNIYQSDSAKKNYKRLMSGMGDKDSASNIPNDFFM